MSILKKGSTVGGFEIVTEKTESLHTHDSTDIPLSGDAVFYEDGEGSGLNVDGIDGKDFNDFENIFVKVSGDSYDGNLIIENVDESNDSSAINLNHAQQYFFKNNAIISPSNVFNSVDHNTFSLSQQSATIVNSSASKVFINGDEHNLPSEQLDITTISNRQNATIYVYLTFNSGNVGLSLDKNYVTSPNSQIIIGEIITDTNGDINSFQTYDEINSIAGNPIITKSVPYGIVKSNNQGYIDESLYDHNVSITENINIEGPSFVMEGGSYTYTITDYDDFSTYSVDISEGSVSINGNTITANIPNLSKDTKIDLTVYRNSIPIDFEIGFVDEQNLQGNVDEIWKNNINSVPESPLELKIVDMTFELDSNNSNRLYIAGFHPNGSDITNGSFRIYRYDIRTGIWEIIYTQPATSQTGSKLFSRIVYNNNYLYVIGGGYQQSSNSNYDVILTNNSFRLNVSDLQREDLNNINDSFAYHDVVTNNINKIYIIGGVHSLPSNYNNNVYEYNTETNEFKKHNNAVPIETSLKNISAEYHKGRIYIHSCVNTNDANNQDTQNIIWEYNVYTSDWKAIFNESTNNSNIGHYSAKIDNIIYYFYEGNKLYEFYPEYQGKKYIGQQFYDLSEQYPVYFDFSGEYDYAMASDGYYAYIYDSIQKNIWRFI